LFREHSELKRHAAAGRDDAHLGTSPRLAPDVVDPLLTLSVRPIETGVLIQLAGDLDVSTVFELREVLAHVLSDGVPRELILDVLELHYVDSMGLSIFLLAHKRATASGFRFALANPSPFVSQLLEVSGLTGVLDVITLPPTSPPRLDRPDVESEQRPVWDSGPGVATL
jgi:anti-sigma B factor antagonist